MPEARKTGKSARATGQKAQQRQPPQRKPARQKGGSVAGQKLRVKQVRSGIGHAETYRRTLRALGLRHHQQEVVVADSPSVRGMVYKVRHLVRVSEEA